MKNVPKKIYLEGSPLIDANISGIGHTTFSILEALARNNKEGYQITVVVPRGGKEALSRWKLPADVQVKVIPIFRRVFNRLNRYHLLPPVDLFLGRAHYVFPNFSNLPLLFSPSFTYIHDIAFVRYPESVEPRNQHMLATKVPQWMKRSTKVITVSNHAKEEIIDYFKLKPERVEVVYNGVDTQHFKAASSPAISDVKKQLGITGEYFLYFGNLEPRKNIERLIQAYKQLPEKIRKSHSLVIAGGHGWLNEPILRAIQEAQAAGYKVIRPEKYVSDDMLPALYSGASALLHVAIYEGFGLSTLQALACKTPVVAANNSSLPEVLGDCAIYCDPFAIDDITKAIVAVTDVDHAAKTLKNSEQQVAKFSWDASAARLFEIFDNN